MYRIIDGELEINDTPIKLENIVFTSDEIKHGNSGIVVFGEDIILNRKVAVKFWLTISPRDDREKKLQGLLEAQKGAQLNHPSFAQVYYGNLVDKYFYMVQEYIEGKTLKQWLKTNPPRHERGEVWDYMYMAIKFAHDRKIYHGDLHWKNIMVQPDLSIKIIDFGTSHFGKETNQTQKREANVLLETSFKMFPEDEYYKDLLLYIDGLTPEATLDKLFHYFKLTRGLNELREEEFDDYGIRSHLGYLAGYITWIPLFRFDKVFTMINTIVVKKYPKGEDFLVRTFLTICISYCEDEQITLGRLETSDLHKMALAKYNRIQNSFIAYNTL